MDLTVRDLQINQEITIIKRFNILEHMCQRVLGVFIVCGIYDTYILCDNGKYKECFLKVDFNNEKLIIKRRDNQYEQ